MKKALIILSLFFIAIGAKAQGNLQFNAVKRFTNNSVPIQVNVPATAGSITVPANKVWKIESGSLSTNDAAYPLPVGNYANALMVDNQIIFAGFNGGGGGSWAIYSPPIWLSAGTYAIVARGGYSSAIYNYSVAISAIEFNITP